MARRGRWSEKEETLGAITHTLEKHPEGLGVRELIKKSGIKSNETFYKYFPKMIEERQVQFSEIGVGRGKPKKVYRLTEKGVAALLEFKLTEHFEKIRASCKDNEQFEIDNYTFAYAVYGMPKDLTEQEKELATIILREINSALLELDNLRLEAVNREAYIYRKRMANVHSKISQYVANENKDKKTIILDEDLRKDLDSCIPSLVKEKMKLKENDNFALVITRGPSFIDEYSLRPENQLLDLVQSIERWDDEGIASVIEQLAKNKYFDQEAIDRIKKWDNIDGRISNFYWQQIKERLDDIPEIRERLKKAKELFIQSSGFRKVLGLRNGASLVVTKEKLGKGKMDELRKQLANLNS